MRTMTGIGHEKSEEYRQATVLLPLRRVKACRHLVADLNGGGLAWRDGQVATRVMSFNATSLLTM